MFGSGILDTIVGLLFVFALVSLLVTTVNEMIAAALRSRARWLRYGIERMLGADWARALYRHPLIAGSARSDSLQRGAGPSYIPSRTFANVLMNLIQEQAPGVVASQNQLRDLLDGAPGAGASVDSLRAYFALSAGEMQAAGGITALASNALAEQRTGSTAAEVRAAAQQFINAMPERYLRQTLHALPATDLRQTLLTLYADASDDLEKFKQNIEVWFNNGMDRVNGWYKRRSQGVTLVVAAAIVLVLNVDAITIFRHLQTYPVLGQAIVGQATQFARDPAPRAGGDVVTLAVQFATVEHKLDELTLPIGWVTAGSTAAQQQRGQVLPGSWSDGAAVWTLLRQHAAGWILTALAAMLGAPFWFDMLNRVISVRSTGKPPEEEPKPPKSVSVPVEPGQSQREADRVRSDRVR